MTLIIGSIFVESVEQAAEAADRAFSEGADAVELRIDSFEGDIGTLRDWVASQVQRTWIVTCRSAAEGGHFRGDTMERVSRLIAAARGTGAYVDFEFADWERSANIRQKVMLAATHAGRTRLILSHHDFEKYPDDLTERVARMVQVSEASVVKVAYRGRCAADSLAALDLMRRLRNRVIAIDMGESGAWTRILAKKFGAFGTFASLDERSATAPGQITIRDMREKFGWQRIQSSSCVFGVIGDPVIHSQSPALFNWWFGQSGENAVYVPMREAGEDRTLAEFFSAIAARSWLDVGGLSVTIPHKETVARLLGADCDPLAGRIGAVNTVVFGEGRARGFNTDCYAASASLATALGVGPVGLVGTTVDVLGAGGSARAVVEGLIDLGCRVTIFARSRERAAELVEDRAIEIRPWEDRVRRGGTVLINCTPVGLWPELEESPMPADALAGCKLVFDLIYNPLETRLLREARSAGRMTLSGLDTFVRQAAMQYELWTGRCPDQALGRSFLESLLGGVGPAPQSSSVERMGVPWSGPCIVLIGMRGAGKTSVGRELARQLGVRFLDSDEEVSRVAGKSIAAIFAEEGEAGFRRRESQVIADIARKPPGVLSLGGGAVLVDANMMALQPLARFVWLTAPAEVLWDRISRDPATRSTRPPLSPLDGMAGLQAILDARKSVYRQWANLELSTANLGIDEVIKNLRMVLSSSAGPP